MPLQGIVLSIIFLKVTSNSNPSIPIIKIVIQITSYWKYFFATFSTNPIPVVPAKNSAATNVPQHIPTATLIPVSISGSEFGKIEHTQEEFREDFKNKEIFAYTSGLGGLFKPGIPIGKINNISEGKIYFFSDFTQLNYVKIVSYKIGGEE